MARPEETMDLETVDNTSMEAYLHSPGLLADYDDGQISEINSEYESAAEEEHYHSYVDVGSVQTAIAHSEQALKDAEAMPPPAMKYPWARVASKDITQTLPEEMPALEDVTADPTYELSQDALEEADKNARRLDELELILGIHAGFDTTAPLDPLLFDDILNKCQEIPFKISTTGGSVRIRVFWRDSERMIYFQGLCYGRAGTLELRSYSDPV